MKSIFRWLTSGRVDPFVFWTMLVTLIALILNTIELARIL